MEIIGIIGFYDKVLKQIINDILDNYIQQFRLWVRRAKNKRRPTKSNRKIKVSHKPSLRSKNQRRNKN